MKSNVKNQNIEYNKRKTLGYQLDDMLVSCSFNFQVCTKDDFQYYYDSWYDNCYIFNSGKYVNNSKIKKVTKTDSEYSGLVLELYTGNPLNETFLSYEDGFIVSIHNQSYLPFSSDSGYKVEAGAETDFKVTRNFVTNLPPPHGSCQDTNNNTQFSSIYFDYITKKLGLNYTQKLCIQACMQQLFENSCHCYGTLWPKINDSIHYCSDMTEIYCLNNFMMSSLSTNDSSCNSLCPIECKSIEYAVSTYRAAYPTKFYAENMLLKYAQQKNLNLSQDDIYKAFVKLNINYESMKYKTTVQTISIQPEDLLSNLGGTLGLYIGISLLSLVEIIELFIGLIFICIKYKKARKVIKNGISN